MTYLEPDPDIEFDRAGINQLRELLETAEDLFDAPNRRAPSTTSRTRLGLRSDLTTPPWPLPSAPLLAAWTTTARVFRPAGAGYSPSESTNTDR
ncbi:hypothetical protein [Actinopolyspora saharensis]|uniref:Uncharacterized protein n=1 Tax=Actinopolyspora saharensis TaxID=995062 RepID=A0A1H1FVI3_9ACTN|nr:hypothetical protein [Actinopolyspora saharensis]SDR04921.1 hypothetical protein SAMN04489718_3263 [Actinopolyspora saharensis]